MNDTTTSSMENKTARLRDGRILGYAEYGNPNGKPLFDFHGHPGSRLEARFLAEQAVKANIRLIGMDRPGMGLSTYQPGRRLLDWPEDVRELADQLGIDRFGVVGFSGGGPYALACASQLPDRLTACGIIAGVGHLKPFLAFLSQWLPWLMLPLVSGNFRNEEQAQRSLMKFSQRWPEPDRQSLLVSGVREIMAASLVDGLRQGTKGAAYDGVLLGRSWGFQLEDIHCTNLHLWHGEQDQEVSVAAGRETAERLAQCKATFYTEDGHSSLIANHAEEIITCLSS